MKSEREVHIEEIDMKDLVAPNPCQEQERTINQLRVQLAGCGVAALGVTDPSQVAHPGDYGWSPAYQDVLDLRARLAKVESERNVAWATIKRIWAAAHGEEGGHE